MSLDRQALKQAAQQCLSKDRFAINKQIDAIANLHQQGKPFDKKLERLLARLESSQNAVKSRSADLHIEYPQNLPVSQKRDEILAAIKDHQVVVVAGETGSGKTTQLPKICLEAGLGKFGTIAHTQPRRLAARSVAQRIAEEMHTELGSSVGYQIRFSDQSTDSTRVKLMTDGILLAQTQYDRFLNEYDCIIIDEAHERSLNIDFLLGFLKQLTEKRRDLKIVITSATIDVERFSRHFSNAPVIEVSGRTFAVEDRYRPLVRQEEGDDDLTLQEGILNALLELSDEDHKNGQLGDVLVFLPGEREIRECADFLRKSIPHERKLRATEILPLYARLGVKDQQKIFTTGRGRRVVLATNVAETSLTVPGIRYVVDSGLARISRYSYRSKVQRLPVEAISQASANQRKGRCGRVAEGVCIRLFSEDDFINRPEFTEPEIQRTNLAAVILQMMSLRLGKIHDFPFIDPPDSRYIKDGYNLLQELEAVNKKDELTRLGRDMARLPVEPRISRMLIEANKLKALDEILIIAAALSVQDPKERPQEKQQAADQKHKELAHEDSDFLSYVNLWNAFEEQRQALSNSQLRKWCQKHFVNYMRMREWRDIHKQLKTLVKDMGFEANIQPAGYESVHRAVLSGLLSHIAQKEEGAEYLGARHRKLQVFPSSSQYKKRPKWLVAAELVETSRLFARINAKVEPKWIEDIAQPLLKKSYNEPHWSKKRGQVIAYEQSTLYGLIINPRKVVDYGKINPQEARTLFIQHGLVERNLELKASFFRHNIQLIDELTELEEKTRTRDFIVEDAVIAHFYDEALPADVNSLQGLKSWLKKTSDKDLKKLNLSKEYLLKQSADTVTENLYPTLFEYSGLSFPLSYAFAPGAKDDGVSITVPASMLSQIPQEQVQWLVPGFIKDKCIALLKGLEKPIRKQLVPVPNTVENFLNQASPKQSGLFTQLCDYLYKTFRIRLDSDVFRNMDLDPHFLMNFKVLDDDKIIGQGRSLEQLIERYQSIGEAQAVSLTDDEFDREGIKAWDFDVLPDSIERELHGMKVRMHPQLKDEVSSVSLSLNANQGEAVFNTHQALIRLIRLSLPTLDKQLRSQLRRLDKVLPYAQSIGPKQQLLDDLLDAAYAQVFLHEQEIPRDQQAFTQLLEKRADLAEFTDTLIDWMSQILPKYHQIQKTMKGNTSIDRAFAYSDIKAQLSLLFQKGFMVKAGWRNLQAYRRYLDAILYRIDKFQGQMQRDRLRMAEFEEAAESLNSALNKLPLPLTAYAELNDYYWLLQELRISLFAQSVGTREPVSNKRLRQKWNEIKLNLPL